MAAPVLPSAALCLLLAAESIFRYIVQRQRWHGCGCSVMSAPVSTFAALCVFLAAESVVPYIVQRKSIQVMLGVD